MKASKVDINMNDFPEGLEMLILQSIDVQNFTGKLKARKKLVGMGNTIIIHLHKLLKSNKTLLRKEASKIVELIAHRNSIPLLIDLLDDPDFDIRWIAAEGLIKIGRRSILPLLKSVRDGKSSLLFNEGAHHVLNGLLYHSEKEKLIVLMQSLENYHSLGETAPTDAAIALKTVFRCKT